MNKNPLESNIESKFKKACEIRGGKAIKIGVNGLPDRMALLPGGYLIFVELKRKGKKPRPLQEYQLKVLRGMGFRAEVVDSEERIKEVLEDYDLRATRISADIQAKNT